MVTSSQTQLSDWTDYGEKHNKKSVADGWVRVSAVKVINYLGSAGTEGITES